MRPVLPDDLDRCARALLDVPQGGRTARIAGIIAAADLADRYRKQTGRLHPRYGDGTLGAAAWHAGVAPRPPRCDALYCACLADTLEGLAMWRNRPGARR